MTRQTASNAAGLLGRILEQYGGTLVACTLTALITAQPYFGFLLLFPGLFLLGCSPYFLLIVCFHPLKRKAITVKMLLWVATLFVAGMFHYCHFQTARNAGNAILRQAMLYKGAHGVFPQALERTGRASRWKISYAGNGGQPILFYPSTIDPFDMYSYDFSSRSWTFEPD